MFATALRNRTTAALAGVAFGSAAWLDTKRNIASSAILCHGGHSHDSPSTNGNIHLLEQRIAMLEAGMRERYGVKEKTGEGTAVFSWDERLTAAFPDACRPFEKNMHGGFNEDPDKGVQFLWPLSVCFMN
jgi:hypothetical protein